MKNFLKTRFVSVFGIIALVAVIGFTMIVCDSGGGSGNPDNPTDPTDPTDIIGSGVFAGKDVLGNSYSLSIGSSAARAAYKNDRINLDVTGRDGNTRQIRGTIQNIAEDGTVTIKADSSNAEFTVNVDGSDLASVVAADPAVPIPFHNSTETIVPRTFDAVYLRATRWGDPTGDHGENWGSRTSILERDFPTNVSNFEISNSKYKVKIEGTSDVDLVDPRIEVQGITHDNQWQWIGGESLTATVTAGVKFTDEFYLNVTEERDLTEFKEVVFQFINAINATFPSEPSWNVDNGSIPADIEESTIMATITGLKISIRDEDKEGTGNIPSWSYAIAADGFSIQYNAAVWHLTSTADVNKAKEKGTLEITLDDADDDTLKRDIRLVWQDPIRGLWWQDAKAIAEADEDTGIWDFADGVSWDDTTKKLSIDLSEFIKDAQFASAQEIRFMLVYIGYWDDANQVWVDGAEHVIDEFGVKGANLN